MVYRILRIYLQHMTLQSYQLL